VNGDLSGSSVRQGSARRLFFALWPDDGVRARLAAAARELLPAGAGRPQRPDQLHLTLEFLGDVPESRLQDVLDAGTAAAAGAAAFELDFDLVEHWKRPQVLCLAASSTPGPLAALVQSLRSELLARGFAPEARPFRPHVTLARRVVRAQPSAAGQPLQRPLRWPARAFALVQSVTEPKGARYVELACWPTGT
jgi:RNA 2',3'-cyclic 3'-phosphodiesterase